jgi:hypothetical protein
MYKSLLDELLFDNISLLILLEIIDLYTQLLRTGRSIFKFGQDFYIFLNANLFAEPAGNNLIELALLLDHLS